MEAVNATVFIPVLIIAVVEIIKGVVPTVKQWLTIIVALAVGVVVALLDTHIGIQDITVAQGILCGLEAVGITAAFAKAGVGTRLGSK